MGVIVTSVVYLPTYRAYHIATNIFPDKMKILLLVLLVAVANAIPTPNQMLDSCVENLKVNGPETVNEVIQGLGQDYESIRKVQLAHANLDYASVCKQMAALEMAKTLVKVGLGVHAVGVAQKTLVAEHAVKNMQG